MRQVLEKGYPIYMPNGGKYIIEELVGAGGFSLVYLASTEGGKNDVVVKEFFPSQFAKRDEDPESSTYKKVIPISTEYKRIFDLSKGMFEKNEGNYGGDLSIESSQVVSFTDCGNGFAVMPRFSKDTCTILDLVKEWEKKNPDTNNEQFQDLGRILYALTIIESLLDVLSTFHKMGYLHLDISANNVLWACKNRDDGRNGIVKLTDFGCSEKIQEEFFYPKEKLAYSREYSAPEVKNVECGVSVKTDLFSVGALLYFMCIGKCVTRDWRLLPFRRKDIVRDVEALELPSDIKEELIHIISGLCEQKMEKRCYNSAYDLLGEVKELIDKIHDCKFLQVSTDKIIPTTPGFVTFGKKMLDKVQKCLDDTNICIVCGESGTGKSELLREVVYTRMGNVPALEFFLPEECPESGYDYEKLLATLKEKNPRLDDDLEKTKNYFQTFLELDSVVLLHNFNKLDIEFIHKYFYGKRAKILIASQCTEEELKREKCLEKSVVKQVPTNEIATAVFCSVFKLYKKKLPVPKSLVNRLAEHLFNNLLLNYVVARQLVDVEKEEFKIVVEELDKSFDSKILDEGEIIKYRKDAGKEMRGTPFSIVCSVIGKILPTLETMEKQCLQFLCSIPSEWVSAKEVCRILGDLPNDRSCRRAVNAMNNLSERHIVQEKYVQGKRMVSVHKLMADVVWSTNVEGNVYLQEPTLEFWQHLEKNAYADKNPYTLEVCVSDDKAIDFAYRRLLGFYKKHYLNEASSLMEDMEYWKKQRVENTKNGQWTGEITCCVSCEHGIEIYCTLITNQFIPMVLAGGQRLPENRYYNGQSGGIQKSKGISCVFRMEAASIIGDLISLPERFGNVFEDVPVVGTWLDMYRYDDERTEYNIILPETYVSFGGRGKNVKTVKLNEGLKNYEGFNSKKLISLTIPQSVEYIGRFGLCGLEEVNLSPQNTKFVFKEGAIYSADYSRLLFLQPELRKWTYEVDSRTKEVDYIIDSIGPYGMYVKRMSIYRMQEMLNNMASFTTFQWLTYCSINDMDKRQLRSYLERKIKDFQKTKHDYFWEKYLDIYSQGFLYTDTLIHTKVISERLNFMGEDNFMKIFEALAKKIGNDYSTWMIIVRFPELICFDYKAVVPFIEKLDREDYEKQISNYLIKFPQEVQ